MLAPLNATWNACRGPRSTRIVQRLVQLGDDPFGPHSKPLEGRTNDRSSRVGGWRIIFSVDRQRELVEVSAIGPRGQIYRQL